MANNEIHSNKMAVMQVLAGLIKNPLLFIDNDYKFDIEDFPERFHQIVFEAIEHLALKGMQKIGYIDIDQFLKQYDVQYRVFCQNDGVKYIQDILELADDKKFKYYYESLKKYSLLNRLSSLGFDTRDIYDPDILDPKKKAESQAKFDEMSVNDILLIEENKILQAKETYGSSSDAVANKAGDGAMELKERYKKTPEMGAPMVSAKLTYLYRGQRKGCLFLESAPQGAGKSRRAAGEACHLAVPEYYDLDEKVWKNTGLNERVLLISTELDHEECETMFWSYIAGVSEEHIIDGKYAPGEEERVDRAIALLEKSQLHFLSLTNFDTEDVVTIIKKYKQLYGVEYVYFDYLSESSKVLTEGARKMKVAGLRTDQILLQMSTALKDVAKQHGIFIWTASQLSGNYKDAKELDSSFLRSAKSLSDKVDVGSIMLPVREMDKPVIESYCNKGFEVEPNFVLSIYKVRRGSYQNIKVYVNFDRSTCRMTDCFVTDVNGLLLPVKSANVQLCLADTATDTFESSGFVTDVEDY